MGFVRPQIYIILQNNWVLKECDINLDLNLKL